MRRCLIALVSTAVLTPLPALAADGFPDRPLRMIVPFPPGGSVDVVARIAGQKMTEIAGQSIVVDNRGGASGNIGSELAARAPADGYTIMMTTIPLVVNPSLFSKVPYDVVRDFAPISLIAAAPFVLAVHPSLPAKSVKELVALARARPGQLNYSSAGSGTNLHIAAELFKNLSGTNIVHVPYKGGGPALSALLGGEAQLSFLGVVAVVPHVKSGKMRALALTATKRSAVLPDLPTIAEAGVAGYEFASWYGVLAPAGTPAPRITKLHDILVRSLRSPDLAGRMATEGADIIAGSPQQFAAYLKTELTKWARVVKDSGLRVE
jgi:tripartite-type tricarboxylate transporter receptor subunit TctC